MGHSNEIKTGSNLVHSNKIETDSSQTLSSRTAKIDSNLIPVNRTTRTNSNPRIRTNSVIVSSRIVTLTTSNQIDFNNVIETFSRISFSLDPLAPPLILLTVLS